LLGAGLGVQAVSHTGPYKIGDIAKAALALVKFKREMIT
jgi:hypothetical protein